MASTDEWTALLDGHPIFSRSQGFPNLETFELSMNSLGSFTDSDDDGHFSGRRSIMCMKDADLLVASGCEIRMTSLNDVKVSGGSTKSYKILHTPTIQFEIHHICLNPNRKLLALAGLTEVAIIVLPQGCYSKLVTCRIDCKFLHVGKDYHAHDKVPIAKVEWHPWGESGSTLLVMTTDGKLREYDVSVDPDEPQKTIDFLPQRRRGSYAAVDEAERSVASFVFGKGKADWGPLTIYTLMKSGDIYAMCPYLPENASLPSNYLHGLECFVAAKQEFANENGNDIDQSFSTLYDMQRKYVNGLLKQTMHNSASGSSPHFITVHPPKSFLAKPTRQGPFLLQPPPSELRDSPGGDATDIAYVTMGSSFVDEDDISESSLTSERIGVVTVVYQDGRVDVCLDLEKVEARWESKSLRHDLPMFTVYEVIDLGIVASLNRVDGSFLIHANHPIFHLDPVHDDTIYVYHAFGVHVLNFNSVLLNIAIALKEDDESGLDDAVQRTGNTSVQAILNTFAAEKMTSTPVVAVAVPTDVYLTYSIFILTSSQRVISFSLNLRTEFSDSFSFSSSRSLVLKDKDELDSILPPLPPDSDVNEIPYIPILKERPFGMPPALTRKMGLPTIAKLALPKAHNIKSELSVTPETLRYLASVVEKIAHEVQDVQLAFKTCLFHHELQKQEYARQHNACKDMIARIEHLRGEGKGQLLTRMKKVQEDQTQVLLRMDRTLQALINKSSPDLNEHEMKWFDELQRMRAQVMGIGRYDQMALKNRVLQLKRDYERLIPDLKEMRKKETDRSDKLIGFGGNAGTSYTIAYERLSVIERAKLEHAVKEVVRLAGRLDISSLGVPPS